AKFEPPAHPTTLAPPIQNRRGQKNRHSPARSLPVTPNTVRIVKAELRAWSNTECLAFLFEQGCIPVDCAKLGRPACLAYSFPKVSADSQASWCQDVKCNCVADQ